MTFDPLEILKLLEERGVRFVLIGGLAAAAHGSPTPTLDIDICYARDDDNLQKLASVLEELDARLRGVDEEVPFLLDPETLRAGDHFTFKTRLGNLDLLGTPGGSSGYGGLEKDAVEIELGEAKVKIASLDHLIAMKEAAGRPKDIAAVDILRALREEKETQPEET